MDKHIVQVAREVIRVLIEQEAEHPSNLTGLLMIRNGIPVSDANQKKVAFALRQLLKTVGSSRNELSEETGTEVNESKQYTAILYDMHTHKPEFVWKAQANTLEQGLKLITDVLDSSHIAWKIAPNGRQVVLPNSIRGDYVLGSVNKLEIVEDILSE